MNRLIKTVIGLALVLLISASLAAGFDVQAEENKVFLYYFYSNVCEKCHEVDDKIDFYSENLSRDFPDYRIIFVSYDIADKNNIELMYYFCREYSVPEQLREVPILFTGNRYYVNDNDITMGLEETVNMLKQGTVPIPLCSPDDFINKGEVNEAYDKMKVFNVFMVGLVNGLNPCSLSMILFLVSLLLAKQEINILKTGMAFIAGKFFAYILLGTILFRVFTEIDFTEYKMVIKIFMALFIAILSYLNIRDYINAKRENYGEIKNQLPSWMRKWNHNIIQRVSGINGQLTLIGLSAVLGAVVSVGEFLCTGQVYLATILYMVQSQSSLTMPALSRLVIYSFAFVIPGSIIIVFISRTRRILEMSEFIRRHMPVIKLLTAIILIIIGVLAVIFT